MKKRSLMLVLMLVMALMLFACNGRPVRGEFVIPEGGFDTTQEVTITFHHTMGANLREKLDLALEDFKEIYPNITVVHEQIGSYDDVRDNNNTLIVEDLQPNLSYCYPDHVALYNLAKVVVTLDGFIESDMEVKDANGNVIEKLGLSQEQKDDFIQGYYEEGKQFGDGKMYTLPFSKSTEVLYYNKTFFEKHGITVPDHWFSTGENDTTSMEYVCAKIKEIDPKSTPLGYDSAANWFITMTEQLGSPYTSAKEGEKFQFLNDTNIDFVSKFRQWYLNGWVTTQDLYGAYTSGLFVNIPTETNPVCSYMSIGSSAGATHQRPAKDGNAYPFEVGIATIPQMDQNNAKVISQGPSVCIFNNKDPQKVLASWLLLKYLTTNASFQAEFSMASGYVPVIKSVVDYEATRIKKDAQGNAVVGEDGKPVYETYKPYQEFLEKADGGDYVTSLSAKVCMDQEKAYYTSPAFNGSSEARDQVNEIINGAFTIPENTANIKAAITQIFQDAIDECEYNFGK